MATKTKAKQARLQIRPYSVEIWGEGKHAGYVTVQHFGDRVAWINVNRYWTCDTMHVNEDGLTKTQMIDLAVTLYEAMIKTDRLPTPTRVANTVAWARGDWPEGWRP